MTKEDNNGYAILSGFWATPNGLAVILTIGVLGILLTLVIIHINTVWQNHETFKHMFDQLIVKTPTNSQSTKELFESFQNYYREANASNTSLLSILLPVIGAWVGAILAFYYGNKNLERMSETFKTTPLSSEEEKLANLKVGDILDKFPDYKKVISAKLSDPVNVSYKKITDMATNILIYDDNNRPIGLLYKSDFTRVTNINEDNIPSMNMSLKKLFEGYQIKDVITDQIWTEKGLDNYAHISKDDTLLQARMKMKDKSSKQGVKGLVLEGDKVLGIVTYELFSTVLTRE